MAKRENQSLQRGIRTGISELESLQPIFLEKINKMLNWSPHLMDVDRVKEIMFEQEQARLCYNEASRRSRLTISSPPTEDQLRTHKENTDAFVERLRDLSARLDEFEESFFKYKVPRLSEFSCFEAYALALGAFMRVWKEESERRRGKGEKNLIEWIRKLDESDDGEKRATFEEMRRVMVDIGSRISYCLGLYFTSSEVSVEDLEWKFREVAFTLGCLRVEENSILIDRFLLAVKYVESEIMKRRREEETVIVNLRSRFIESILLYQIFREVLRFEVAFSCPDLPMMLINEVFLGMRNHLLCVFEKRLKGVTLKINDLKTELRQSINQDPSRFEFETRVLFGVKELWNNLDLNQN